MFDQNLSPLLSQPIDMALVWTTFVVYGSFYQMIGLNILLFCYAIIRHSLWLCLMISLIIIKNFSRPGKLKSQAKKIHCESSVQLCISHTRAKYLRETCLVLRRKRGAKPLIKLFGKKSHKQRMLSRSMSLQIGWDSNGERFWSNIPCHYWPCFRRPVTIAWWLQPGPLCIEDGFCADISWQTNLKSLLSNFGCLFWPLSWLSILSHGFEIFSCVLLTNQLITEQKFKPNQSHDKIANVQIVHKPTKIW